MILLYYSLSKLQEEANIKESLFYNVKCLISLHILASGSYHATFTVNMSCRRRKNTNASLQVQMGCVGIFCAMRS